MESTTKLEERIAWIKNSDYPQDWKDSQIAGAMRSEETRLSVGEISIEPNGRIQRPTQNTNDTEPSYWMDNTLEIN